MYDITETLDLCRTTSRIMDIQIKKKAIVNYVYRELGITQQMTAYFLNLKNHTSIQNHLQNHHFYLKTYDFYSNFYEYLKQSNLDLLFKDFYNLYRKNNMESVYLAGKITGLERDVAWNNFQLYEDKLTELGFIVINPIKIVPPNTDWKDAMKICIKYLLDCEKIYFLDNYKESKGAILEQLIAKNTGIKRFFLPKDDKINKNYEQI